MKIENEHYEHMKRKIAAIWTKEKHEAHHQFVLNEGKSKDTDKRVRWDWMHYAKLTPFICDNIYSYANDNHINTALKRIIKELEGYTQ